MACDRARAAGFHREHRCTVAAVQGGPLCSVLCVFVWFYVLFPVRVDLFNLLVQSSRPLVNPSSCCGFGMNVLLAGNVICSVVHLPSRDMLRAYGRV